jgi:predicted peroxiredoxin
MKSSFLFIGGQLEVYNQNRVFIRGNMPQGSVFKIRYKIKHYLQIGGFRGAKIINFAIYVLISHQKQKIMKKLSLLMLASVLMLACNQNGVRTKIEKPRDGVFVHITHDHSNPHRVLMPLRMASMMAEDKDVLVYLDIDAVKLLTKDAADIEYKQFPSLKTSLQELIERNVGIYACPGCLTAAGIDPEDLIEGVELAQKDRFFDFTEGRIITLDY